MRLTHRKPARWAAAITVAAALVAACGNDASVGGEVTLERQLTGAWNGLGIEQDGDFTPTDEGTFVALLLQSDGTGSYFTGEGEPSAAEVCATEGSFTWRLSDDGGAVLVQFGETTELTWTIVEIDADSFTFDEGSDLFPFDRLGSCE